jgi:membrane associated rhomboid family serine protease
MNLGDNWTPLTRNLIVGLFVLYVGQLLAGDAVTAALAWQPFGAGFLPWQPLTNVLLAGDPTSACLGWLGLFFLVAPVERALGTSGLARAVLASWVGAVALGLAVASLGRPDGAVLGLAPILTALVSLFGWSHPGANILLFFVIPIRAELIAWGTGALSFLWLLVALTRGGASPTGSALALGAWVGALAWSRLGSGEVRRLQLAWKRRNVERQLRKFEVIEGGRAAPPRSRKHDETYH